MPILSKLVSARVSDQYSSADNESVKIFSSSNQGGYNSTMHWIACSDTNKEHKGVLMYERLPNLCYRCGRMHGECSWTSIQEYIPSPHLSCGNWYGDTGGQDTLTSHLAYGKKCVG